MNLVLVFFCNLCIVTILYETTATCTIYGSKEPGDELLHHEHVFRAPHGQVAQSYDVVFPKKGKRNEKVITAIVASDLSPRNNATTSIKSGGPGKNYVTVHLKALPRKFMNYIILIYGRISEANLDNLVKGRSKL
ncbi:uncharacterized protein LOC115631389 [Scaptodrosophila lebanonensis]|uniref:Uncharacterized protein LOC115631389 n=1 Tax=Drosophila lebanonensis TaxID=7225 RepID=A0A6J2U6L6_DROLE|nr:uncharacterized protein LOC115631389 [Scaptodrosophila lebanonensis]